MDDKVVFCKDCEHFLDNSRVLSPSCKIPITFRRPPDFIYGKPRNSSYLGLCKDLNPDGKCANFEQRQSLLSRVFSKKPKQNTLLRPVHPNGKVPEEV